jgi:hypothetical protein
MATPPKAMVALLNSSDDVIARLREALDEGGFRTVAAHIADVQLGVLDLVAWMSETAADVILVDLPRPDEQAINFLRLYRDRAKLSSASRRLHGQFLLCRTFGPTSGELFPACACLCSRVGFPVTSVLLGLASAVPVRRLRWALRARLRALQRSIPRSTASKHLGDQFSSITRHKPL